MEILNFAILKKAKSFFASAGYLFSSYLKKNSCIEMKRLIVK
jgi:hypothetical protein